MSFRPSTVVCVGARSGCHALRGMIVGTRRFDPAVFDPVGGTPHGATRTRMLPSWPVDSLELSQGEDGVSSAWSRRTVASPTSGSAIGSRPVRLSLSSRQTYRSIIAWAWAESSARSRADCALGVTDFRTGPAILAERGRVALARGVRSDIVCDDLDDDRPAAFGNALNELGLYDEAGVEPTTDAVLAGSASHDDTSACSAGRYALTRAKWRSNIQQRIAFVAPSYACSLGTRPWRQCRPCAQTWSVTRRRPSQLADDAMKIRVALPDTAPCARLVSVARVYLESRARLSECETRRQTERIQGVRPVRLPSRSDSPQPDRRRPGSE